MHPVNCTESGKIQKFIFFHKFWAHSIKQMMHRFYSWVGRTCVHAVYLCILSETHSAAPRGFRQFRGTLCTQFLPTNKTCASFDYYTLLGIKKNTANLAPSYWAATDKCTASFAFSHGTYGTCLFIFWLWYTPPPPPPHFCSNLKSLPESVKDLLSGAGDYLCPIMFYLTSHGREIF